MSILRVEEITKLDGSPFFPDLSPFILQEEQLTGDVVFPDAGKLYLVYDANLIYLPEEPTEGARIAFTDFKSEFAQKPITLLPANGSGHLIGGANALSLSRDNQAVGLIFQEGNWVITWDANNVGSQATVGGLTPILFSQPTLNAQVGNLYLLNGTTQVNLPVGTLNGRVAFADFASRFGQPGFNVTIFPAALQTIGGSPSYALNKNNEYVEFVFRQDRWILTESNLDQELEDGAALNLGLTFPNDGLKIQDAENSEQTLTIRPGENLSSDRTLTINVSNNDRVLNLLGDSSLLGTNTGDQSIGLVGDVFGAPDDSLIVTTISNGAVTPSKLIPINELTILGRTDPGIGVVQEVSFQSLANNIAGDQIGQLVQIEEVGGVPGLPALDGSQLTNLPPTPTQLEIRDEGNLISGSPESINLVGPFLTATASGNNITITSTAGDATRSSGLEQFAPTSSVSLRSVITDETGTGSLVFGTAPTINNANLTGIPVAPLPTALSPNNQVATKEYVDTELAEATAGTVNGTGAVNQLAIWADSDTLQGDTALSFNTANDTLTIGANGNLAFGASVVLDDNAGFTTLTNIDALDATTEATIEAAIDTLTDVNLAGNSTAVTAPSGNISTRIATTEFVANAVVTASAEVKTILETVKNVSGGTLPKGTPVHIVGNSGNEAEVIAADALLNYPAQMVLNEELADEEVGQAVALGFINNVPVSDAAIYTPGDEVWLAAGGGWTTARPNGPAAVQKLGVIIRVNTSADTISGILYGMGANEDLPNLPQGRIWVGNSNGVPQPIDFKLGNAQPTTSAELASVITDETGTGSLVFANSPALAGTPTAPTAILGTNTTQIATTAFVQAALAEGGGGGGGMEPLYHNNPLLINPADKTLYLLDTTSGAITVTLPIAPADGYTVGFSDYAFSFGSDPATINVAGGSGHTFADGTLTSLSLETDGSLVQLAFWNNKWVITSAETFVDNGIGGGGGTGTGTGLDVVYHNGSTLTAQPGKLYLLDTLAQAITVHLPPAPTNGTVIEFADYRGNFATNNVTINRSGSDTLVNGALTSLVLDTNYAVLGLAYRAGNWTLIKGESFFEPSLGLAVAYASAATLVPNPSTIYLLDTSANAITVNLPTNPANGTRVEFSDAKGTFSSNPVTINATGTNTLVDGSLASIALDTDYALLGLAFYDGNWSLTKGEAFWNPGAYVDPLTTTGDLLYRNSSNQSARLPIGASGNVLTVVGGLPTWANSSGTGMTPITITPASSPYSALNGQMLLVDTTTGAVTVNLPPSGGDNVITIVDAAGNTSTNAITINRSGSDTILGDTALTVTSDYANVTLAIDSASTDWKVADFSIPLSSSGFVQPFVVAIGDETTPATVGNAKVTFRSPYRFELSEVRASCTTAPTDSGAILDINADGVSILSTKLRIDPGEETSVTSSVPAVFSNRVLEDDVKVTIDIDQVGSTVPGAGYKVTFIGRKI